MMIVVERPHFVLEELVERAMNATIATMGSTELADPAEKDTQPWNLAIALSRVYIKFTCLQTPFSVYVRFFRVSKHFLNKLLAFQGGQKIFSNIML